MKRPNYNKIYLDILWMKFPDKLNKFEDFLKNKESLSVLDIVRINESIFGCRSKGDHEENQRYRAYDESTILEILRFQVKNNLNNSQLALHFKLSRNTVSLWKKQFKEYIK